MSAFSSVWIRVRGSLHSCNATKTTRSVLRGWELSVASSQRPSRHERALKKSCTLMSLQYCQPNYEAFTRFLEQNEPCLFGRTLCDAWPARTLWRRGSEQPDWEHLSQSYGTAAVTLWDCASGEQEEVTLAEALRRMKQSAGGAETAPGETRPYRPVLYIKDWHLALHCEQQHLPPFYTTPRPFLDDWMNDFYLSRNEDFRFVYAGLQGSFTGVFENLGNIKKEAIKGLIFQPLPIQVFTAMCMAHTPGAPMW